MSVFTVAVTKLIFFFDTDRLTKREAQVKRRLKNNREIARFPMHHTAPQGSQAETCSSSCPGWLYRFALKALGQETLCRAYRRPTTQVASYGFQNNCLGILEKTLTT